MKKSLNHKWLNVQIKDITIGDAYNAWIDGVSFVCGDGKLRQVTGDNVQKILGGKGV
jgi:hypothetical protein